MTISAFQPGETLATTLSVDSYQYYVLDADGPPPNYARGTELLDGVIGPQPRIVQVATGVPTGDMTLILHAFAPPSDRSDTDVSAEADLSLQSGHVLLHAGGESKITLDWPGVRRLRLRVVVHDRDAATRFETQETHELWMWPIDEPTPRWRSTAIDGIGRSLTVETGHLRAQS